MNLIICKLLFFSVRYNKLTTEPEENTIL